MADGRRGLVAPDAPFVAVEGVEWRLVGPEGPARNGEIWIRGASVCTDDWLRTGDAGRMERSGFVCDGRLDDVVSGPGGWTDTAALRQALASALPSGAEAEVVCVDGQWVGVVGCAEWSDGGPPEVPGLDCVVCVAGSGVVPRHAATGKVNRAAVTALVQSKPDVAEEDSTGPRSTLAACLRPLLKRPLDTSADRWGSFASLGGDSKE